ncbi:hypothetical protein PanWU01x14_311170 [Parasponia andersonii]|uniref:Uncharacterized protein n=1 Tax=Parasponia andersonii TaxID=3476 RepID=A0A2P5AQ71_PARAD|nr:hypothetical protein PanWU01x14_311170 [Parasponia andersonii]
MEEEPEFDSVESSPEQSRQHHKVVVVHPDEILIWVYHLHDFIGEGLVGLDVGPPLSRVEPGPMAGRYGQHVMKQRPEIVFTEPMVELDPGLDRQERGQAPKVLEEELGNLVLLRSFDLGVEATHVENLDLGTEPILELEYEAVSVKLERPF